MFDSTCFDDDSEEILMTIDRNIRKAQFVRRQIEDFKCDYSHNGVDEEEKVEVSGFDISCKCEEWDDFFDIASFSSYFHLESGYSHEEFLECLPSREDDNFIPILLRLKAESLKEIKVLFEFYYQDESLSIEEKASILELVRCEEKKIEDLEHYMDYEEEKEDSNFLENKIILMPTQSGKIRILEDLDHITSEFYPEIFDLIRSIENGTFKRIRKFNLKSNPVLGGVCEVRGSWARVLFQRIDCNTYVLISAFIKKAHNTTMYRDIVRVRSGEFRAVLPILKNGLSDPEFMEMNDLYVEELYRIIGDNLGNTQFLKENRYDDRGN